MFPLLAEDARFELARLFPNDSGLAIRYLTTRSIFRCFIARYT